MCFINLHVQNTYDIGTYLDVKILTIYKLLISYTVISIKKQKFELILKVIVNVKIKTITVFHIENH